jgi:hypothetical protein
MMSTWGIVTLEALVAAMMLARRLRRVRGGTFSCWRSAAITYAFAPVAGFD